MLAVVLEGGWTFPTIGSLQPYVTTKQALLIMIGGAMVYVFWQMVKLMLPKKGHKYTGSHDDDGLFHGRGRLEALNGDTYDGEFVHGYFSGKGKYLFKKNEDGGGGGSYEGEFREGHFWGVGKETYPDGSVYEGDFVQGKRHGKGRILYGTGTAYTGDWKDGKKHGKGLISYADGTRFDGWFVEGNRHGVGKIKDKRGKKTYAEWEYGTLVRPNVDAALYRSSARPSSSSGSVAGVIAPPTTAGATIAGSGSGSGSGGGNSSQPSSGRLTPRERSSRSNLPALVAIPEKATPAAAAAAPTTSAAATAITIEATKKRAEADA